MPFRDRNKWAEMEHRRLLRYQHQHRGLNFVKMQLPPTTDRRVNVVGVDHHIYKGRVPRVPLDQLPPGVDPMTIDEEALFKEIRDMEFPPVPPQEYNPRRRIGGEYTTAKVLSFAPVGIHTEREEMNEAPVIGTDGKVYKGTMRQPVQFNLEKETKGAKCPPRKTTVQSSLRDKIIPTTVALQVNGKAAPWMPSELPVIDLPATDVRHMIGAVCDEIKRQVASQSKAQESKDSEQGESKSEKETIEEDTKAKSGSEEETGGINVESEADTEASETEDSKEKETTEDEITEVQKEDTTAGENIEVSEEKETESENTEKSEEKETTEGENTEESSEIDEMTEAENKAETEASDA